MEQLVEAAQPTGGRASDCCGAAEPAGGCCAAHDAEHSASCHAGAGEAHHGYIGNKENYLRRLKRIEGQARGIHRMVEEEQYCIDILTQISAVTKALQSVALGLLDDHMNHCVLAAAQAGGQEAEDKMVEVSEAIARLVRS